MEKLTKWGLSPFCYLQQVGCGVEFWVRPCVFGVNGRYFVESCTEKCDLRDKIQLFVL